MSSTGLDRDPPRTVSEKIIESISNAEGEAPTRLTPPLYDVVDPEALDDVTESIGPEGTVAFEYCGYDVRVSGDGDVSVED